MAPAVLALSLWACTEVPVVQGVGESEANRVVAALDHVGIAAHKAADESAGGGPSTFHVAVGADDVARAVSLLNAEGMPHREQPGFAETFGQSGSLVQTTSEERARAAQAVAGELSRTIGSIEGVLDARVHVSLPDPREITLDGNAPPRGSASVLVRHAGMQPPIAEDAIRKLVAGAAAGLRPEDVAVVTVPRPAAAATTAARLAWVGPIAVAPASAGTLRAVLVGSVAVNVLLAATMVWLVVRRRREGGAASG